ncbi:MAG: acyltransferase family protein [Rhizomicrobium sp.]
MSEASSAHSSIKYRPDIDGLRAVAVVAVVLYHYTMRLVPGGYVGVDVFFVISGYLITQTLSRDLANGRFSIIEFYERRVRRIVPPLVPVFLFVAVASYFVMLPHNLLETSQSLITATLFVSNFFFWSHTDYFNNADYVPLLHTWSLAIEEQYYLLYPPILLFLARRGPRAVLAGILSLLVFSFLIEIFLTHQDQVAAFYLGPARAWELLLGGLLAQVRSGNRLNGISRETLGMVGLFGIGASVFLYSGTMVYPGYAAMLPCLATCAVIYAGASGPSMASRVLSLPPVVFVGRISYALYLWHWPLGVLTSVWRLGKVSPELHEGLLVAAVMLATASTFLIEQPFRKRGGVIGRRPLFALAGATSAVFVALGSLAYFADGLPQRFSPAANAYAQYEDYFWSPENRKAFRIGTCFSVARAHEFRADLCLKTVGGKKNILLFGDSLAAQFGLAVDEMIAKQNGHLLQATRGVCPPFVRNSFPVFDGCHEFNAKIYAWISTHKIDGVMLSADWYRYSANNRDTATLLSELRATIDFLRKEHIPVFLIGPTFRYSAALPIILARYAESGDEPKLRPSNFLDPGSDVLDRAMKAAFGAVPGVAYISLIDRICKAKPCPFLADGNIPFQGDSTHLTLAGARFVSAVALEPDLARVLHGPAAF